MSLLAVVYNPIKVDLDALRAAVEKAESEHGWEPSLWLETTEDDPGCGPAEEAVERGADVVLACGGDGTVRAVGEGLRGTDTALALLPAGTGNLLARNMGMDVTDIDRAVDVAFTGTDRRIDVGIADMFAADGKHQRHTFLVMAGVGLDAQMIVNTDDGLKKKVGWLAYVKAIAASLPGGRRLKLRIRLNKEATFRTRAHTLVIGNVGELVGNIPLLPDAQIDDGVLDLVTLRPKGPIGWIRIMWTVLVQNKLMQREYRGARIGGKGSKHALHYRTARSVEVQVHKPEPLELDGDLFGEMRSFAVQVDPLALTLKMPPAGDD
ncbi:diacylglycerol/lipid kinase family protein [Enemella sp. A6]|uniref:diacylglycerol/lipid kinase family protein n=1 Tax=Enemella sp. A6 TaxID=3440152 RepID=UPI003EBA42BD